MQRERSGPVFLSPADLARRWNHRITEKTLANWRDSGRGPVFTKLGGRIAYGVDDVIAFEARPGFGDWLQRRGVGKRS